MWIFSSVAIPVVFFLFLILAFFASRRKKSAVLPVLIAGTFLSGMLLFLPLYTSPFTFWSLLKGILVSAHDALQLYVLGNGFSMLDAASFYLSGILLFLYHLFGALIFISAPILTMSFLVLLLHNVSARLRLIRYSAAPKYAFSSLTSRTLFLAKSIREKHPRAAILFFRVKKGEKEKLERAAASISAITFSDELFSFRFPLLGKEKDLILFAMEEREENNAALALSLLEKYADSDLVQLYVLSSSRADELLLSSAKKGKVKLRRISEERSFVNEFLFRRGGILFDSALRTSDTEKKIHAAVFGLDRFGQEMAKALVWFCQMAGFSFSLDVFDLGKGGCERLLFECPELFCTPQGEKAYEITLHPEPIPSTPAFADAVKALAPLSFVFVSTGSDEENITLSADLRMYFERKKEKPLLFAIVNDAEKNRAYTGLENFCGESYGIELVGSLEDIFSEEVLLNSELEAEALHSHLKWGDEASFWQYEYYYRSSVASAIHRHVRQYLKIAGADKSESELTPAERESLESLEHQRWNAYMRTQGYVYSSSPNKDSRNDLGKMHHNLISFNALSEEDKRKDSAVASK